METGDRKSKIANRIFYAVLILLILGSVSVTFYKYYIAKDFQIVAEVSCDSVLETCFHYEPTPCDVGDLECVPEEAYDYKIISKNAASIFACEQTVEKVDCNEELFCLDGEKDCSYEYCTTDALSDGVTCTTK